MGMFGSAKAEKEAPSGKDVRRHTYALSRQGTLKYAVKKHAVLAKAARGSTWCTRFLTMLRVLNVLGALAIVGVAIVLTTLASIHIANAESTCREAQSANSDNNNCIHVAFEMGRRAAVYIVISFLFLCFAGLTIATDGCQARCVARFFGFMAYNVWKGFFSIFCGLGVAWIGNEYQQVDRGSSAVAADLALFAIGMLNCGVGLLYVFFGSCNCISVASTPLKKEFSDYRVALRMYREVSRSEGTATGAKWSDGGDVEHVTIQIRRAAEGEGAGAAELASVSAAADTAPSSNPFGDGDEAAVSASAD